MELINATRMAAGYTVGMDPEGREHLVVVAKGTWVLPLDGAEPTLAREQLPPVEADLFTGDPGFSAPLYETDFALVKLRCDTLLNGSAYAPGGKPATSVDVAMLVGSMRKAFTVLGDRFWYVATGKIGATNPQPFEVKPISYDVAFGGVDNRHPDQSKHDVYYANPVGRGFHRNLGKDLLENTPLPNTEERGEQVKSPNGKYRAMAFGPVGRGWQPRIRYAGTYDQDWIDNTFPFLPTDFEVAYYQCAPEDQQADFLQGGERVELLNLTPTGRTTFNLPTVKVPVAYFYSHGDPVRVTAVADTLILEPDHGRFTITWRSSIPLKRHIFEVQQVLVGERSRGWWRAKETGKKYYASLDKLVRGESEEVEEDT